MSSNLQADVVARLFDQYFAVIPADTPEQKDAAHALRYHVYCVENNFLNSDDFPDGREFDSHDEHSEHAVLTYRQTGEVAGCVRLVLPLPATGVASLPLHGLLAPDDLSRLEACASDRTAEISRYAVSKRFRRREGEEMYPTSS